MNETFHTVAQELKRVLFAIQASGLSNEFNEELRVVANTITLIEEAASSDTIPSFRLLLALHKTSIALLSLIAQIPETAPRLSQVEALVSRLHNELCKTGFYHMTGRDSMARAADL
ncbi:hypothetical protein DRN94_000055 [archaeon]|nr:hypothetical protein [archaeon]